MCLLALACLLCLTLAGCPAQSTQARANGKLKVVTTIYPLADWIRQIAGDQVEVTCLLKAGMSPHTYEPTPQDMELIAKSDAFFSVGLGLEEWVDRIAQSASGNKLKIHSLGDEAFKNGKSNPQASLIDDNPHVWLDPILAISMCREIVSDLQQARPDLKDTLAQGLTVTVYERQLSDLARECEGDFPGLTGKGVVTFHNGLTYLLRRCGLKQLGVIEEFPGKEPSAAYLEDLVRQMRSYQQRVVFGEMQLSDKPAQVLAQELGGRVETLDYMGDSTLPDRDTYVKMIRYNVAKLKDAIQ